MKGHKFRRPDSERITHADFISRFEIFDGRLRRKPRPGVKMRTGHIKDSGYESVKIDGREYYVHHLVWFYYHKRWPIEIDHIDRCKINNRIENLREVTRKENQAVLRKPVIGTDESGTEVRFASITDAAKFCHVAGTNISAVLKGRYKKSGGMSWRYGVSEKS